MKREEKWTPQSSKTRSVYKYELQATNQILRDTLDIYPSSLHSSPRTYPPRQNYEELDEYLFDQQSPIPYQRSRKHNNLYPSLSTAFPYENLQSQSYSKLIPEYQLFRINNFKQQLPKSKSLKIKRQLQHDTKQLNNEQNYESNSQNEDETKTKQKRQVKGIQSNLRRDNVKELKRQRRGLANISLMVKNIVGSLGRMTFKDVSDQVLKQSENDLPTEMKQRQKEMKNIRRRVYDALNVLVSVGILGKDKRCVVHTQFTRVPGKKLSQHWQQITQKHKKLEEQQQAFVKKQDNLKQVKKQFEIILMLHQRNKAQQKSQQDSQKQKRFLFPLVFIFPSNNPPNKLRIDIDFQQNSSDKAKRYIIQGSDKVLTDLSILKLIDIRAQLGQQQIKCVKEKMRKIDVSLPQLPDPFNFHYNLEYQNSQDIYLQD